MKVLKILRRLLEAEKPPNSVLINEEEKWFKIGFNTAKTNVKNVIVLLEEEDD